MIKKNGFVLAAFLMASASPMALAQTATTDTNTGVTTGTGADTTTGTGAGTTTGTGTGTTTGTGTGATTGTGTAGTGTAVTPGTDSSMTDMNTDHMQLITSLSVAATGEQDWESEFEDVSEDTEVTIVKLSELKDAEEEGGMSLLDDAMSEMEDSRDDMRSAIENHDALTSALEDEDYSVDDVVAVVVNPGMEREVSIIVDDESDS